MPNSNSSPSSFAVKFAKRLKKRFRYLLSKFFKENQKLHQEIQVKKVEAATHHALPTDYKPSQQEFDAFRMKGIVLLKDASLHAFIPELLKISLKDKVEVELEKNEHDKWVIKLSQSIERFGHNLKLEGRFVRDPNKKSHSIPVSFILKQSK